VKYVPHTLHDEENSDDWMPPKISCKQLMANLGFQTPLLGMSHGVLQVLQCLLARMKHMKLDMEHPDCWLFNDNMPAHATTNVRTFLAQKVIAMLNHLPHFAILAPEDFFLLPKLKLRLKKFTNLDQ
jgi:hypothetical protein